MSAQFKYNVFTHKLDLVGLGNTINGITTIDNVGADGSGNFVIESTDGSITITDVPNGINLSASGGIVTEKITGNDMVAVPPTAGNINLLGAGSLTTSGNAGTSTETISLTGLTAHNVLVGAGTSTITKVAPSTAGFILTSNGAASDPSFQSVSASGAITTIDADSGSITPTGGVVTISGGTTGLTTTGTGSTLNVTGILLGKNGGTGFANTGLTLNLSGGTTGDVLTSDSSGNATWHLPAASSITITGDSGGGLTGSSFTFTGGATGLTFAGAGSTETLGGTLNIAHGGTGASTLTGILTGNGTSPFTASAVTQYDVLVGGASNAISSVGPGTAGQILQSGGNAANPSYSTSTYPSTNAANTLLYASSANTMAALATANDGVLITSNSGVPSWLAAGTTGQVLTATTGSSPSWQNPATGGTVTTVSVVSANGFAGTVANPTTTPAITLTTTATGVLSGNGTAISGSAITQHDVLVGGASNAITSVSPSTATFVLTSNGTGSDPSFQTISASGATTTFDADSGSMTPTSGVVTISGGTTGLTTTATASTMDLTGTLNVAHGGTGDASFTAYSVITGGTTSTGALQNVSGVGTAGQVLTSNGASALPTWQNGASVLGITTVNHAASPYTVLSTDQFLAVNVSGGVVTIKLPNAPTTGRVIYVKDSNGAAATSNISVTTVGGSVTIDGQTTYTMNINYQSLSLVFDGTNYEVF